MPPDLLDNFQSMLSGYTRRSLNRLVGAVDNVSQATLGMSAKDALGNILIGAEPIPFVEVLPKPAVNDESTRLQLIASILAPGVPFGPVFKNVPELLKGMRAMPTRALLGIDQVANTAIMQRIASGDFGRVSASGSPIMSRGMIESEVIANTSFSELANRAISGDLEAQKFIEPLSEFNTNIARMQADWAFEEAMDSDALLQLLDMIEP